LAKPTHGDKIRLAPSLSINKAQVVEAVEIMDEALKKL
jgi:acetylornithine/succinyldiaminopimelate/putrescine aminotransferase